jgi:hypothetical protein
MKTLSLSLIAVAAACGLASAQTAYTTPVGYTTQTLTPNVFNLVGMNVLKPTLAAGQFTAVSGTTITDSNINFTTTLPAGKMCTLEITSGSAAGTVQEFTSWSGSDITIPAAIAGAAIGDKYAVRVCPTLQESFPIGAGLIAGSVLPGTADKVWVPTGAVGGYTRYWFKTNDSPPRWRTTPNGTTDGGVAPTEVPLVYTDGVLVEKRGAAGSLVMTGEVKTSGSNFLTVQSYNVVSIVPPVGLTLFTSGLHVGTNTNLPGDIAGSVLPGTADIVWVPTGTGTYNRYWWKTNATPPRWHTTSNGTTDTGAASDVNLPPSIFIQQRSSTPKNVSTTVPSFFSNL